MLAINKLHFTYYNKEEGRLHVIQFYEKENLIIFQRSCWKVCFAESVSFHELEGSWKII